MRFIDISGEVFGKLTTIGPIEYDNYGHIKWLCKCDCGNKTIVSAGSLKNGNTKSCGCIRKKYMTEKNIKHNLCGHPLYFVFFAMKQRCYNENNKRYHRYGGRGIKIYKEWYYNFKKFYGWAMKNGYQKGLTIDRIDNNGHYIPSNCRFVTNIININNK